MKDTVDTDLGLVDLLQLSLYAPKLTSGDIRSYYIRPPYVSSWITEGGAYVLLPNEEALNQMLTQAMSASARPAEKQAVVIDVMNGTNIEGYANLAATQLNYAGYETNIVPPDRTDYAYSVLIDKTAAQDPNLSSPILNVMGMQPGGVIASPDSRQQSPLSRDRRLRLRAVFQAGEYGAVGFTAGQPGFSVPKTRYRFLKITS